MHRENQYTCTLRTDSIKDKNTSQFYVKKRFTQNKCKKETFEMAGKIPNIQLRSVCYSNVSFSGCSLKYLDIPNGDYTVVGNSFVRYTCNSGFELYGQKQIVCLSSRWSSDPPMCIGKKCFVHCYHAIKFSRRLSLAKIITRVCLISTCTCNCRLLI